MKNQAKIAILMLVLAVAMGGRIFPWGEPFINWPNKGMITNIKLFFSLEDTLPSGGYLRVRFPFSSQFQPGAIYVYQQTASRGETTTPTLPDNKGEDSSSFFFGSAVVENSAAPFDNYYTFNSDLQANINYVISFEDLVSPTDVGWLGWIQMSTLSAANSITTPADSDIPLTWDSNLAFAPVHILAAPGTPSLTSTIASTFTPNTAGAQYTVDLSLKLSQDFWYWPTIVFTWDNSDFTFSGCVNVDNGTNTVPPTPLSSSQYSCSISSEAVGGGSITILHNAPILKTYNVIYSVSVTNPNAAEITNIGVWVFHRYNLNLTDYDLNAVTLSVTNVPNPTTVVTAGITNTKLLLSWGVDLSAISTTLTDVFQIYGSGLGTEARYQAMTFQFGTTTTMSSANYTVTINICSSSSDCEVLGSSISHNFGSSAGCYIDDSSAINLVCSNVTTIQNSQNNLAARIRIASGFVSSSAVPSPFGGISVSWVDSTDTTHTLTGSIPSAQTKASISLASSDFVVNQNGNGPMIAFTSGSTAWTTLTASGITTWAKATTKDSGLTGGIYGNTASSSSIYNIELPTLIDGTIAYPVAPATPATNFFGSTTAELQTQSGVDVFLNPNLWTAATGTSYIYNCFQNGAPTTTSAIVDNPTLKALHCQAVTSGGSYTRLRQVYVAMTIASGSLTGLATASGTNLFWTFIWQGFVNLVTYTGTSIKADKNVDDVYVIGYLNTGTALTSTSAGSSTSSSVTDVGDIGGTNLPITAGQSFFFNQYRIAPYLSTAGVSTIYKSITFWISGFLDAALPSDDQSVSLIRVRGLLVSGDTTPSSNNLALFFNPSSPSLGSLGSLGPALHDNSVDNQFRCWTSSLIKCTGDRDSLTPTSGQVQLLDFYQIISTAASFTTSATNTLSILTSPLSNSAAAISVTYRIAFGGSSFFFIDSADSAGFTSATKLAIEYSPATPNTACTTTTPDIGLRPTGLQIDGSSVSMNFGYSAHVLATSTNKLGTIVWCAEWNFQGSSFAFPSSNPLESSPDRCVAFDYQSSGGTSHWCIYCPMASTVPADSGPATTFTLSNFVTFPATTIISGNVTYGQFSDETYNLVEQSICSSVTSAFTAATASAGTISSVYSQPGQKIVFSGSLPNSLREIDTIVYDGRTQASYSSGGSDSGFPQGNFDANAICYIASSSSNDYNDYIQITCPSSGASGTISFTGIHTAILGSGQPLQNSFDSVTSYKLVTWGFNGGTAASPAETVQYFIMYSERSTILVDQTKLTAATDLLSWSLSTSTAPTLLSIQSVAYDRPLLGVKSSFHWQFSTPSTRPIFWDDSIVFNLDAVVSSTQNKDNTIVACRIMDTTETIHNQNFQSCTLNSAVSPATLTIIPWIDGEYQASNVEVILDNMIVISPPTGASSTVWGSVDFLQSSSSQSLTRASNASTELASGEVSITGNAFPTNYPALTKFWGQSNTEVDVQLSLISNFPVNGTGRVTVDFPYYYNLGLSTRGSSPTCMINGQATNCFVTLRSLAIDGFPVSVSVNTAFTIYVSGVAAPPAGVTADNFYVQVNQDDGEDATWLVYAGLIKDVLPTTSTVGGIHVNWFTSSSQITRSLTTLTWIFNPISTQTYNSSQAVQVIFPPWWGLVNGRFTPTCNIYDYAVPSTVYTGTQTITGNRVNLPITTTINEDQIISLQCQNVRTPEYDGTYPSQDIQIRIVDAITSTTTAPTNIYQHSAPSVHNVNYNLAFAKVATLNYIDWTTTTTSQSNGAPGSLTLPRGTYGVPLTLNVPGRSDRNFQVNVAPASFSFYNDNVFNVSIGYPSFSTWLGCGGSVPVNTYTLLFTITDNSQYTPPSAQWVQVTDTLVNIGLDTTGNIAIEFATGTISMTNPITFSAIPWSDITITPSTNVDNTNFTVSPSSVTLNPTITWGAFVYMTTGSTTSTGGSAVYSYALSGTNAASYNVPAPQTVSTSADTNNYLTATPTLSITADGSDQGLPTSKILDWNLAGVDTATVYWGCQIVGTWTLTANGIYENAVSWGFINPWSVEQGQYDWDVLTKQTTSESVSGLIPDTWYDCRGFVQSESGKNSSVATYIFKTGNNGASYNRFLFNHSTYPNPAQRQALLCTLIETLATPLFSVFAITGETCGNTSAFYTINNSSGTLAVYFWPRQVDSDNVMTLTNLQASLNTTATLQALNASVVAAGGVAINNIIADGQQFKGAVNPTFPSSGSVTTTSVAVSGCSLNVTGFIIAVLGSNSSSATPYTLYEAGGAGSSGFLGFEVAYYAPSLGSVGFNFTGLTSSTSYNLFLAGTDDDPSPFYSNVSAVTTISLTTATIPTGGLALFCSIIMALVAMISILI